MQRGTLEAKVQATAWGRYLPFLGKKSLPGLVRRWMMTKKTTGLLLLALVNTCFCGSPARADIVYSDLGSTPSNLYSSCGQPISPGCSSVLIAGNASSSPSVAVPFTPSQNFELTQIDVAIQVFLTGGNTPYLNLALYPSSNGQPGTTALASWTEYSGCFAPQCTILPVHFTCCDLVSQTFSNITLQGGEQYWIAATPGRIDTTDFWELNSIGLTESWLDGTCTVHNAATCSSLTWNTAASGLLPAFDVQGIPLPEPPSALLLLLGVAVWFGFSACRHTHSAVRFQFPRIHYPT
jgi:hypothetical protein